MVLIFAFVVLIVLVFGIAVLVVAAAETIVAGRREHPAVWRCRPCRADRKGRAEGVGDAAQVAVLTVTGVHRRSRSSCRVRRVVSAVHKAFCCGRLTAASTFQSSRLSLCSPSGIGRFGDGSMPAAFYAKRCMRSRLRIVERYVVNVVLADVGRTALSISDL